MIASSPNAPRSCRARAETHPLPLRITKPPSGERRTFNMRHLKDKLCLLLPTHRSWQRSRHKKGVPTFWGINVLYMLLLLLSVSSELRAQSFSNPVDCTYANSTCTDCADVCTASQLYTLLPSTCHPSAVVSLL